MSIYMELFSYFYILMFFHSLLTFQSHVVMLFQFSCISPQGKHRHLSYLGPFESGFADLSYMVSIGWQLLSVEVIDTDKTLISLPVDAFSGVLFANPLSELQQEWEKILS